MIRDGKRFRFIMHDMSNFSLPQPSDEELNKALWNTCYERPCGKGEIFT